MSYAMKLNCCIGGYLAPEIEVLVLKTTCVLCESGYIEEHEEVDPWKL